MLVNCTTLRVGGGVQVGVSFFERAIRCRSIDFSFALSPEIFEQVSHLTVPSTCRVQVFSKSPARPIAGHSARQALRRFEADLEPSLVYSLGFPSYMRFSAPEVGRHTNPWEIFSDALPWDTLPAATDRLRALLSIHYRNFFSRRAKMFETQTEAARGALASRFGVQSSSVAVVPNTANDLFVQASRQIPNDAWLARSRNVFLCLAAPYYHKNLEIIPDVARQLTLRYEWDFVFRLTVPEHHPIWHRVRDRADALGVSAKIESVGPLSLSQCLAEYLAAKIAFIPSRLEVASAAFLEAIWMKVPVVASDLWFSREACGPGGAAFFDPTSPSSAASAIASVIEDPATATQRCVAAIEKVCRDPSNDDKYRNLFEWLALQAARS